MCSRNESTGYSPYSHFTFEVGFFSAGVGLCGCANGGSEVVRTKYFSVAILGRIVVSGMLMMRVVNIVLWCSSNYFIL